MRKDKMGFMMKDNQNTMKKLFWKCANVVLLTLTLCSCGSYSSSFVCPDSKGANCRSMGDVYTMIKSGEIEVYNKKNSKCRGRDCQKKSSNKPHLKKKLKKIEVSYK